MRFLAILIILTNVSAFHFHRRRFEVQNKVANWKKAAFRTGYNDNYKRAGFIWIQILLKTCLNSNAFHKINLLQKKSWTRLIFEDVLQSLFFSVYKKLCTFFDFSKRKKFFTLVDFFAFHLVSCGARLFGLVLRFCATVV